MCSTFIQNGPFARHKLDSRSEIFHRTRELVLLNFFPGLVEIILMSQQMCARMHILQSAKSSIYKCLGGLISTE